MYGGERVQSFKVLFKNSVCTLLDLLVNFSFLNQFYQIWKEMERNCTIAQYFVFLGTKKLELLKKTGTFLKSP